MAQDDQCRLRKLKSMSEQVHWEIEKERYDFLDQLDPLIRDWKGVVPNLRDIFEKEKIECLLSDSVSRVVGEKVRHQVGERFVRFVIRSGYEDEPEVDKDGKPSLHRTTAVHRAARNDKIVAVRDLFTIYNRFDVNYTDDDGLTHFHVACMTGCVEVVEKFLVLGQVDPNCLVPKTSDSPLHIALRYEHEKVIQLLLRNGADPNLAGAKGLTPLHVICKRKRNYDDLLEQFFEINDEKHQLVQVDARDMFGNTPLNLLCKFAPYAVMLVAESLLQRGADPNLADEHGLTPLHVICKRGELDDNILVDYLFELCKVNRPMQVNVADKLGLTPLHLAVEYGFEELVNELLTRGADPNQADVEGLTPLHIICQRRPGDDLASSYFHYNDKLQQTVQVNVRDKLGRTPLQAAVARFLPETVNELLNRGADMSTFVFPTDSYSSEKIYMFKYRWVTFKLRLASGALDVVKNLEKGGYELKQSDALTVMKFFAKNELFQKSDLENSWCDEEEFVSGAKKIITRQKVSLYDLIQSKSKEAANLLIHTDFRLGYTEHFDKASLNRFFRLPKEPSEACSQYLCKIILREFFQRWSLEPLLELTGHYQLPILCCEIIIEKLTNEDLFNVCLAAAGQNS